MPSNVQLAAVPAADSPGTLLSVHHEKRSYLFGRMFEGTQRALAARNCHMHRAESVFLSGCVEWPQLGGLLGSLLSIAGSTQSAAETAKQQDKPPAPKLLQLHGGDNLAHVMASLRAIVYRQMMRLQVLEQRDDPRAADPTNITPDWEDDAIKVWKVPVKRDRSSQPPKRRHESPVDGSNDPEPCPPDQMIRPHEILSNPEVAALIVEKIMFCGVSREAIYAMPTKLGLVKPDDTALIKQDGQLKMYKHGSLLDEAAVEAPGRVDHNDMAWVLLDQSQVKSQDRSKALNLLNHILPKTTYSKVAMSYIVKAQDRRGKMNAAVAKSLGVQGSDFRKLAAGESIQVKDGTTVTPDMVMGDPIRGNGFVLADISSVDFLDAFLARPEWHNTELLRGIQHMYWNLGAGMAIDPKIHDFIRSHPEIRHIFCAPDVSPNMLTSPKFAAMQVKLHIVDPVRFPLAQFNNAIEPVGLPKDLPIELGQAGMAAQLMPRFFVKDSSTDPFVDLVKAANDVDQDVRALARLGTEKANDANFLAQVELEEKHIPNRDAEIIPLGTGSSAPSLYRNVSSTLIRVPGIGSYILDCGEGTLGQIERMLGSDETQNVLRELRCIVVSHLHADHHLGTITLIKAWYEQALRDGRTENLAISCIGRYRAMLDELAQVEDFGMHRLQFINCKTYSRDDRDVALLTEADSSSFGLASVQRIAVDHCWKAHAVRLELTSGLIIAYSGDCRPSEDFARACEGAHLLIHECTFDDDLVDHAVAKKHSSISEALGVARNMKAHRTLLTHFSQRYVKADSLKHAQGGGDDEDLKAQVVLMAFDMMRVRLGEFRQAACYAPAIQKLMESLGGLNGVGETEV